jgi:hypothetical protein
MISSPVQNELLQATRQQQHGANHLHGVPNPQTIERELLNISFKKVAFVAVQFSVLKD